MERRLDAAAAAAAAAAAVVSVGQKEAARRPSCWLATYRQTDTFTQKASRRLNGAEGRGYEDKV